MVRSHDVFFYAKMHHDFSDNPIVPQNISCPLIRRQMHDEIPLCSLEETLEVSWPLLALLLLHGNGIVIPLGSQKPIISSKDVCVISMNIYLR